MKTEEKPIIVAAGILFKDGEVLISRRPSGSFMGGYWEFPGGKKEPDETITECLARELKEELGILAQAGEIIKEVEYSYPGRTIKLVAVRCTTFEGEPRPLGCQAVKWVKPRDLSSYAMCPPDLIVAEAFIENNTKKEGIAR